jgi:hypothetical protein
VELWSVIAVGRWRAATHSGADDRLAVSVGDATLGSVSVNIDVSLTIRELRDERERAGVTALLTDVLEQERLGADVFITLREDGESLLVQADSDHPVIFSRFYLWREEFEQKLARRVAALVPHARVDFDWGYPDED